MKVFKYPALNSRMVNLDTPYLHKLFNVSIGGSKSKLKVNRSKNNEFGVSVVLENRK